MVMTKKQKGMRANTGKIRSIRARQRAFGDGWKARQKKLVVDTNPHEEGEMPYVEWRRGWFAKDKQEHAFGPIARAKTIRRKR